MATVYLAGGMHSDWQERVKQACPNHRYIDPCCRNGMRLTEPAEYTAWDLAAVAQADIIFAYMEVDNPSGIGMACEAAYGKALGKLVVFVNEHESKYLRFVDELADVSFTRFLDGLHFLSSITW